MSGSLLNLTKLTDSSFDARGINERMERNVHPSRVPMVFGEADSGDSVTGDGEKS